MKLVPSVVFLSAVLLIVPQRRHDANADIACPTNCKTRHCDQQTGECSEGCNKGFFRKECNGICQCGGGACDFIDGTCIGVATSEDSPVSSGCETDSDGCKGAVFPVVVCVLCLLLVNLLVLIGKEQFLKMCKGRDQQHPETGEKSHLMSSHGQNHLDSVGPGVNPHIPVSPQPSEQFTDSQRKLLVNELGVHFLNPNVSTRNPFILFCAPMKFDKCRLNTRKAFIDMDRCLVNEPGEQGDLPGEEAPERFNKFHGTSSFSPIFHGDCPTYWEVHSHVELKKHLYQSQVLLCIGLCREAYRDIFFQIPSKPFCYNLNVRLCSVHKGICTKVYRDEDHETNPPSDEPTGILNIQGQCGHLQYGILVNKGKEYIMFFDLITKKLLCHLEKVNFDKPLWPMFGVFKRSVSDVIMKLETGRHIEMSPEKKKMILDAVSGVR